MNRTPSNYPPPMWLIALLASALVTACGGGNGGQDLIPDTGGISGSAPSVTAVSPTQNPAGVPTNTKMVTASFTKAMDPATLTAASFALTCPVGTPQAGSVGYVTTGNVATLTLTNSLPPNTMCTATIATSAKDISGTPLASGFVWTFAVGQAPNTTAPAVTGTFIGNGATKVATNARIGAIFGEGMDPSSISNATFTLQETATGTAVAGTISYSGVTAVFTPLNNLATTTNYTVTIKGGLLGVKNIKNIPMAADYVASWTTGVVPSLDAPFVFATTNANGATNVAVNTRIGATFNEGMDPLTINNATFTVKETATGAAVAATVSYSGVTAVFTPLNNLTTATNYTVTVKGGLSGVKNLMGIAMPSDFVLSWTTDMVSNFDAPFVTRTFNANGANNVPVGVRVGVAFNEGMDPLTINNATFTVKETSTGAAVAATVSYSDLNAVFTPFNNLSYSTNYTVTVKGGLLGATNLRGIPMASDYVVNWTTSCC